MNTFVKVTTINRGIHELSESFLHDFDIISFSGGSESQALALGKITRKNSKPSCFFWNEASGDDAIFFSDFGDNFQFTFDPQIGNAQQSNGSNAEETTRSNQIQTVTFPTLAAVLKESWGLIPTRHQPLSKVFVMARVAHRFRYTMHLILLCLHLWLMDCVL